jgi:hypothetical protein
MRPETFFTRAVVPALAGAASLAVPTAVLASAHPAVPPVGGRNRFVLAELGTGTATPDPCLDRAGRCGFTLKGTLAGTPADATFFGIIDDGGRAGSGRCVPARYVGLFSDGPDQSIAHVSNGQLCPDGHGGLVFEGRYRITGGLGPFDGIRGRGRLVVLMPADGSVTVSATGPYSLPR